MLYSIKSKVQDPRLYLVFYTFSTKSKLLLFDLDFKHAFFLISFGEYTPQGFANRFFKVW
jgi:hypothetical protein